MIVYDKTEFHKGIDLNGTDVENSKFPRVDRNGLFVDEVRSNPSTGRLEIWNGTEWIGYVTKPIPEGTLNQTMRYGLNGWTATSSVMVNDTSNTTFSINHKTQPEQRHCLVTIGDTISSLRLSSDATTKNILLQSGGTAVFTQAKYDDSKFVISYASATEQYLRVSPTGSPLNYLTLRTTTVHTPSEKLIRYGNYFAVYQDGKIESSNLAGATASILGVSVEGVIERISLEMPKTKIFTRDAGGMGIQVFTAEELGITGDLTEKIISFEIMRKPSGSNTYALNDGIQLTFKTLYASGVSFAFEDVLPVGDTLRLAITYIE